MRGYCPPWPGPFLKGPLYFKGHYRNHQRGTAEASSPEQRLAECTNNSAQNRAPFEAACAAIAHSSPLLLLLSVLLSWEVQKKEQGIGKAQVLLRSLWWSVLILGILPPTPPPPPAVTGG